MTCEVIPYLNEALKTEIRISPTTVDNMKLIKSSLRSLMKNNPIKHDKVINNRVLMKIMINPKAWIS